MQRNPWQPSSLQSLPYASWIAERPLYSQIGGMMRGCDKWHVPSYGWPSVTMKVLESRIVLQVPLFDDEFTFERKQIEQVEGIWRGCFPCIRIVHANKNYPPYVAFGPFPPTKQRALLQCLSSAGYIND